MKRLFQKLATILLLGASTMLSHAFDANLVPRGAAWKYLDTNTDKGTAWKEVAYDDSTWASGPAPLGFGDPHIVTPVASGELLMPIQPMIMRWQTSVSLSTLPVKPQRN